MAAQAATRRGRTYAGSRARVPASSSSTRTAGSESPYRNWITAGPGSTRRAHLILAIVPPRLVGRLHQRGDVRRDRNGTPVASSRGAAPRVTRRSGRRPGHGAQQPPLIGLTPAVGLAGHCLDGAVGYAAERHQFGHPIGSFQAVKHICADTLTGVELARAAARRPSQACSMRRLSRTTARQRARPRTTWTRPSRSRCSRRRRWRRRPAAYIQILGGIGFELGTRGPPVLPAGGASAPLFGTATAHRLRLDPSTNASGTARGDEATVTPPPPGTPAAELTAHVRRLLPLHRRTWGDDDSFAARLDWQAALDAVGWIAPHWPAKSRRPRPEHRRSGGLRPGARPVPGAGPGRGPRRQQRRAHADAVRHAEQQAHLRGIQAGTEVWCQVAARARLGQRPGVVRRTRAGARREAASS